MKVWVVIRGDTNADDYPDIVGVTPDYTLAARIMSDDFMSECKHNDINPIDNEDAWLDAYSGAIMFTNDYSMFWHMERKELCHV